MEGKKGRLNLSVRTAIGLKFPPDLRKGAVRSQGKIDLK